MTICPPFVFALVIRLELRWLSQAQIGHLTNSKDKFDQELKYYRMVITDAIDLSGPLTVIRTIWSCLSLRYFY